MNRMNKRVQAEIKTDQTDKRNTSSQRQKSESVWNEQSENISNYIQA